MCIYILIFIFLSAIYILPNDGKKRAFYIIFYILVLSLLAAFRGKLGADTGSYARLYENYTDVFSLNFGSYREERGFVLLASICKTFHLNRELFFLICALLTNTLLTIVILRINRKVILPALLLFYCTNYLHFEFNIIRHGMMVMCVWMAITYIHSRKMWHYFLWILIGSCFHKLALFFIPFYWILNLNIDFKWAIIIVISCIVFSKLSNIYILMTALFVGNDSIEGSVNYYTTDYGGGMNDEGVNFSLGFILNIVILFLTFVNNKLFLGKYKILRNALLGGICSGFIFASVGVFAQRIMTAFYLSLLVIVPMLVQKYSTSANIKYIFKSGFLLYCFLYLYMNLNVKTEFGTYQFIPYIV